MGGGALTPYTHTHTHTHTHTQRELPSYEMGMLREVGGGRGSLLAAAYALLNGVRRSSPGVRFASPSVRASSPQADPRRPQLKA